MVTEILQFYMPSILWYTSQIGIFQFGFHALQISLLWRHNGRDSVPINLPYGCSLNRSFRHRSKKTSKLRVTGLCAGNSPVTGEFPHKGPVTRKMFPFDDVIMLGGVVTHGLTCNSRSVDTKSKVLAWEYPVGSWMECICIISVAFLLTWINFNPNMDK